MRTKVSLTYVAIIVFFLLIAIVIWVWYQQKIDDIAAAIKKEYSYIPAVVYVTLKK